jgi:hypothetical protein
VGCFNAGCKSGTNKLSIKLMINYLGHKSICILLFANMILVMVIFAEQT